MQKTDYSQIAATYNHRYKTDYLVGVENELKKIVLSNNYRLILQVVAELEDGLVFLKIIIKRFLV
ncbi:MAG: hypothetical protein IPJ23_00200 [Ignavibacteriales bacterium]|nr:hypothetical protein [Ignavibacteriales bacterium]